ncbi:MAG: HEPN domain-containing protein [Candidatus Tectomicrobia bacterium]|nr:HEPN domain-containing protein [Candidatus Tectomicrobia bacterium]
MDIDEHVVAILNELVPKARYERRGRNIAGADYRSIWNSPVPALSHAWIFAEVTLPDGFEKLTDALRLMLKPFITSLDGKELVHTKIGLVAAGFGGPTELDRFARQVLTSAVLIGPARTVKLLREWANGEPVRYTRFTVLSGFRIEGDQPKFPVEDGLTIQSLPSSQDQLLALGAPEMWVGSPIPFSPLPLGGPQIYGSPAMVTEMALGPLFSQAQEVPLENKSVASGPFGLNDPSFHALSLACNSPVSPSCGWSRIPVDVQSFVPWARFAPNRVVLSGGDHTIFAPSPTLTHDSLGEAIELCHKLVEHGLGNNARTALARWTKSMQGQFADRFIDLRIALEALYAPDGGSGEISYRVQTRCARHMAHSFDDRMAIAKEVKRFYNTASRFAHGSMSVTDGSTPEPKHEQQLERARAICRYALTKIIEQNKGRDINVDRVTLA